MTDYESLRRQCRTLESLLDVKLTSYSRLAANIGRGTSDVGTSTSGERWQDLEEEINGLLEKLQETNGQLSNLLNNPDIPPSQSMVRTIQRHRDVMQDYEKESRRTKANVKLALDQANLLSGVRNDIDAYKSSATESLLAERGRIDESHRMTDDILEQAYETRAEFGRQRSALSGIQARMMGVINTMPGIDNLLSMIKSRRRRDAIILGVIIGLCFIFLFSYWTR